MIIAIIATLIALVTAIIAVIAAQEVITDQSKPGWNKLNTKGYWVIGCAFLMVILPFGQFYFQNQADAKKEADSKKEQNRRETELRKDYQASVLQIRRDFGDSNYRTLTIIGQTLAKYKLQLDTAEKSIRDSAKIVLADQPVLDLIKDEQGPGINYVKYEKGYNHYRINFMSIGGASSYFKLKATGVVLDSVSSNLVYKGRIRIALSPKAIMAKGETTNWEFTIDNSTPYDWLYLWVRGTYADRNGTHLYKIDRLYYHKKGTNEFGSMDDEFTNVVLPFIRRYEKD